MATPVSETIIDAIEAACKLIHTDNGASFTPLYVSRHDGGRLKTARTPGIVIVRAVENWNRDGGGAWRFNLDVVLNVVMEPEESSPVRLDTRINEAANDVKIAIIGVADDDFVANLVNFSDTNFHFIDDDEPEEGSQVTARFEYEAEGYTNPGQALATTLNQ